MKQIKRTVPTKAELLQLFEAAPDNANLDRRTVAAWLNYSLVSLEIFASRGDGPPYFKTGRRVSYKKRDVVEWFNQKSERIDPTSAKCAA